MSEVAAPPSAAPSAATEALMGQICEDFLDRLGRGEQPLVEDYAGRYPQLATAIRQVFPALEVIRRPAPDGDAPGESLEMALPAMGCLGDFRILTEIGRGGMGVVYEAEQISLDRRVALKVLPFAATLDPKQLQRFKNEAQAAGQLHHTNIVPVHFVGCERGVHFYAMQYIEGQSLAGVLEELRQQAAGERRGVSPPVQEAAATTAHQPMAGGERRGVSPPVQEADVFPEVAAAETPPQARLSTQVAFPGPGYFRTMARLGAQAADALDHAHQLGVVHRDIKPGNLLVDVRGNLWVTDFGLAQIHGDNQLTLSGDLVGTLRYMSPEQALAKRVVIDHRTDIYSLGATLYELLTLEPVFAGGDRQELLRQIAFEEPKTPRRHDRSIPAELEIIVMKALEKNSADRYATAKELADDLQRFLKDEPIRARRPSLRRRVGQWCRRHQTLVWSLITTAAVLAGTIGYVLRDQANQLAGIEQRVAERLADARTAMAAGNLKLAHKLVAEAQGHLGAEGERLPAWNTAIDDVRRELETRFAEDLRSRLGGLYAGDGWALLHQHNLPEAIAAIRRSIEVRRDKGEVYWNLGVALAAQHKLIEAVAAFRQAVQLKPGSARRRANSDYYFELACTLADLEDMPQAAAAYRTLIKLNPGEPRNYYCLGNILRAQQKFPEAEAAQRKAIELNFDASELPFYSAVSLEHQGQFADALASYKRGYELLSPGNGIWSMPYTSAAWVRHAEQLVQLDAKLPRILKGELQPADTAERFALAEFCQLRCRPFYAASARFYGAAFAARPKLIGELRAGIRYGAACAAARAGCGQGKDAAQLEAQAYAGFRGQALAWLRADLTGWRTEFDKEPDKARNGVCYEMEQWRQDEALSGVRDSDALAKLPEAERREWRKLWDEVEALSRSAALTDDPDTLINMYHLAMSYHDAGKLDQADRLFRDLLERTRKKDGPTAITTAGVLASLGFNLVKLQRYAEAEPFLRECLAIREKQLPDDWLRFNSLTLLGDAFLGQRKYAVAEPLLLEGYEGMKQREAKIPNQGKIRLPEAIERIARLYEATEQPDKARIWREKLPASKQKAD